jgi:GNAT superfamily N-acetyltransferase
VSVRSASTDDLPAVLPLVRAYCEFYETTPEQAPDEGLDEMCRALIAAPDSEGLLLVAEDDEGAVVGFAACGWKWSSLRAARVVVLEDLFVIPDARGGGHGRNLIAACAERARENGAAAMEWVTATDNARAQAVYDSVGAEADDWRAYVLELRG